MEQTALTILGAHRIMAISTLRPDGWPQTTIVGYANEGFDLFFLIFRSSQKFANIANDDRISIAVGEEPERLADLKAIYAGARAAEVTDPEARAYAWRLLVKRHPNLAEVGDQDFRETALMRATCIHVSALDFEKGLGHKEVLTLAGSGAPAGNDRQRDEWGSSAAAGAA